MGDSDRERTRQWKLNNPDRVRESAKRYSEEHREEIKEKSRLWRLLNRAQHRAYSALWKKLNPDKSRENAVRYNATEGARESKRRYRDSHPEINLASTRRYRARKVGAGGEFTPDEWKLLCEKYGYVCLCCGEKKPLTADHIVPLSKGGTNYISNIQPLCLVCNDRKGTKTIDYRGAR